MYIHLPVYLSCLQNESMLLICIIKSILYKPYRYLNWNCLSSLHQVGISNELYAPSLSVFVDSRKKSTRIYAKQRLRYIEVNRVKADIPVPAVEDCKSKLQLLGCALRCQRMTNFSEGAYSASEKIYRSH